MLQKIGIKVAKYLGNTYCSLNRLQKKTSGKPIKGNVYVHKIKGKTANKYKYNRGSIDHIMNNYILIILKPKKIENVKCQNQYKKKEGT